MTDEQIMAALRYVPSEQFDMEVIDCFMKADPGADNWVVFEVIASGQFLVFTYNGDLKMEVVRNAYIKHAQSLPTVGAMQ